MILGSPTVGPKKKKPKNQKRMGNGQVTEGYLVRELSSRWSGEGTEVLLRTAAE